MINSGVSDMVYWYVCVSYLVTNSGWLFNRVSVWVDRWRSIDWILWHRPQSVTDSNSPVLYAIHFATSMYNIQWTIQYKKSKEDWIWNINSVTAIIQIISYYINGYQHKHETLHQYKSLYSGFMHVLHEIYRIWTTHRKK